MIGNVGSAQPAAVRRRLGKESISGSFPPFLVGPGARKDCARCEVRDGEPSGN
jgi:hypothetical protein